MRPTMRTNQTYRADLGWLFAIYFVHKVGQYIIAPCGGFKIWLGGVFTIINDVWGQKNPQN